MKTFYADVNLLDSEDLRAAKLETLLRNARPEDQLVLTVRSETLEQATDRVMGAGFCARVRAEVMARRRAEASRGGPSR